MSVSAATNSASLSLMQSMHNEIWQKSKERPPIQMCSTKEGVVSSDYFYSMVELLNGKSEVLLRERKFQHLKLSLPSEHPYEIASATKKELFSELKEELVKNKPVAIKTMLVEGVRANKDFDLFQFPVFGGEFEIAESELRVAYNQCRSSHQTQIGRYENLIDILNLKNIDSAQLHKDNKKLTNWDKSDQIFKEVERVWPNVRENILLDLRTHFARKNDQMVLKPIRWAILEDKTRKELKDLLFGGAAFLTICKLLFQALVEGIEKERDTSTLDVFFDQNSTLINKYVENARSEDFETIKKLLKEQKQHSLARFCQLSDKYEGFVRHAKMIEQVAEKMHKGAGAAVRETLCEILQHSHYLPESIGLKTKTLQGKEGPSRKPLTVKNNHHQPHIMGHEKDGHYQPSDTRNAIHKVNTVMQLYGTHGQVKDLQRAHTFPFPAMFNWKSTRVREILAEQGIKIEEDFRAPSRFITLDFFKAGQHGKNAELLDNLFKKELKQIKDAVLNDVNKFVYSALLLLKSYYLMSFSETELVPDFINSQLDTLSEWADSATNYYSKTLALAIVELLKKDVITKKDVALVLKPYSEGALKRIKTKMDELDKENTNSIFNLAQRIGGLHLLQAHALGLLQESA